MTKKSKKVTMQSIADRLNISKNAVSLALSNRPGVSDELREEILETARQLNYTKFQKKDNSSGKYFLVIFQEYPDNTPPDPFYYNILCSVISESTNLGYHAIPVSITPAMEQELVMPSIYDKFEYAGIILLGRISKEYAQMASSFGIPIVMLVQKYPGLNIDYVISTNEEGSYDLVNHLIACGHTKIGFIAPIEVYEGFSKRFLGYQRALKENGIEFNKAFCLTDTFTIGHVTYEIAPEVFKRLSSAPTAWCCGNDPIAISLLRYFNENGVSVPDDISIVGFDGLDLTSMMNPPITTYYGNINMLGIEAVTLLHRKINGSLPDIPIVIHIGGQIRHGKSVKVIK